MDAAKIKMAIKSKVICLVKYEMERSHVDESTAFSSVASTELYTLIKEPETRLYLEPIEVIREAFDIEKTDSADAMKLYVSSD